MNINNIFNLLHKTDTEFYEKVSPRRHVLQGFSAKVAAVAVPFALGAMFKKAYGQTSDLNKIGDALSFALTLEYLEDAFYKKILASTVLLPSVVPSITKIAADEAAHVAFLRATLSSLGKTPQDSPTFDFSGAAGMFDGRHNVKFQTTVGMLELAQIFEDLGVMAYKGQVAELTTNNEVLTAAMRIHSVEARHAARIRMIRSDLHYALIKPWVIGDANELDDAALRTMYNAEDSVVQVGINIPGINGFDISTNDAKEAFDEPMTREMVMDFVTPFIAAIP